MKKLFLIATLLGITAASHGQTIDTTVKQYAVVKIQAPFKVNWNDTTKAYYLNVSITSDNLKDAAQLRWVLFSQKLAPLQVGDATVTGTDYLNWNGNNLFPFQFIANKLGIQLK